MTDHDDHREWNDVHALSGAYAVDALDDLERARFEEHLRRCPDCREEVDSLREAAAMLAVEPVEPPARLRADVLAGIEEIRPLPPLTGTLTVPAGDDAPRRRRWLSGTGPLLVAAALVLVALAGTLWVRPWADDEQPSLNAAERVLTADDAREYSQQLDGTRVTVVVSPSEHRAVLLTDDMAPAPDGRVYQVWFLDADGHAASAGLMPDERNATLLLDGDPAAATGVGISVEPDGGSAQPTTTPIVTLGLTT